MRNINILRACLAESTQSLHVKSAPRPNGCITLMDPATRELVWIDVNVNS
jgi:hypothetical protein